MAGSFATAFPSSLKAELGQALHNWTTTTGHTFKIALGKASASLSQNYGATQTNYGSGSGTPTTANLGTDELGSGSGYTTGGFAWTAAQNLTPQVSGTNSYWQWSVNPSWSSATFTTNGCLGYNSSSSNRAVYVGGFGTDVPVVGGTFTLLLPSNVALTSLLQIN